MKLNVLLLPLLLSVSAFEFVSSQCFARAVGLKRYYECVYKSDYKPFKKPITLSNTGYKNVTISFYSCVIPELTSQLAIVPNGYYLVNMTISRSKMDKIGMGAFTPFPKLEVLILDHNNLTVLEGFWFNSSTNLKLLNLSFSNVSTIQVEAFNGLASLESLDLSHNNIIDLKDWSFRHLHFIKYLNVSHNAIKIVENNVFHTVTNLLELNLGHNHIETIPPSFMYLSLLNKLDLSNNRLTQLNPKLFTGLISLKILDISNNKLKEIIWSVFKEATILKDLDLSGNPIGSENFKLEQFPAKLGLVNITLGKNRVPCSTLAGLISKFKLVGVTVKRGVELDEVNINGVGCKAEDKPVTDGKWTVEDYQEPVDTDVVESSSEGNNISYLSSQISINFCIIYTFFAVMLVIYLVHVLFYNKYCRRRSDSRNMKDLESIIQMS